MNRIGLKFSGEKTSGVIVPYNKLLQPNNTITVEAIIFVDDAILNKPSSQIVSTTQGGGYSLTLRGSVDPEFLKFGIRLNGVYNYAIGNHSKLKKNKFNHIAGTFDGRYVKVYINGVLEGTNDMGTQYPIQYSTNNALTIANDPGSGDVFDNGGFGLLGIVAGVRLWNIARTEEQIRDNMFNTLDKNIDGLVGCWNMDEGTGDIINDSSVNKLNGTIYEAEWVDFTRNLIQYDSKYYSIKPEYYPEGSTMYSPLDIVNLDVEEFNAYGFNNINELTKDVEIGGKVFKPIDKFEGDFKLYSFK